MLAAERHARIADALQLSRVVSTDELAAGLGVSIETVRRDLIALEQRGSLRRVHGGATLHATFAGQEAAFTDRSALAAAAKQAIGRAAADLVRPGQTVILDVGTTAVEVARALPAQFTGTVATCSLLVAAALGQHAGVEVLLSGGRLRAGDLALSNAQTVAFFTDLRADVAFLGSGGLDPVAGLTDFHLDEVATRRVIMTNAVRSFVLADATKFHRVAPHRVCALPEVDGLITEADPPAAISDAVGQVIRAG